MSTSEHTFRVHKCAAEVYLGWVCGAMPIKIWLYKQLSLVFSIHCPGCISSLVPESAPGVPVSPLAGVSPTWSTSRCRDGRHDTKSCRRPHYIRYTHTKPIRSARQFRYNSVSWRRPHSMWMNVSMYIWDYSSFWRTFNPASDTHATLLPRMFRYDLLHSVWVCVWTIKPSFTVHIPLNEGSYWLVFPLIVKLYLYNHSNLMGMYELKQGQYKITYIRGS